MEFVFGPLILRRFETKTSFHSLKFNQLFLFFFLAKTKDLEFFEVFKATFWAGLSSLSSVKTAISIFKA